MTSSTQPTKRCFTDAARAAALAARQAKARLPKGDGLEVFAVRGTDGGKTFSWEIRRFGGVSVEFGDALFETQAEAIAAGRRALARHLRGHNAAHVADRIGAATSD